MLLLTGNNIVELQKASQAVDQDSLNSYQQTIETARDYKGATMRLAETLWLSRGSLHRDYSNASMLALGGAITFLTVSPDLIKTPWLFVIAIAVLTSCMIVAFAARSVLVSTEQKMVASVELRYVEVTGPARALLQNPNGRDSSANQTRLSDALARNHEIPQVPWIGEYGHLVVGALFFLGVTLLAASLTLKVAF